jgi:hypothetical protein
MSIEIRFDASKIFQEYCQLAIKEHYFAVLRWVDNFDEKFEGLTGRELFPHLEAVSLKH